MTTSAPFTTRPRKSPFIHYFDKTPPGIVCPHFYVLSHGNGCPYACDYCYLQLTLRYVKNPVVFSNRQDLLNQVGAFLSMPQPTVLSAGELSDSLAFDDATGLSKDLVPLFAAQDRHKLVFLTKSANVRNLLEMKERKNVIVSFSVNAPEVSARFERLAPPPEARLKAAGECQRAGYEVRLRIDPIVPVEGWRAAYQTLLDLIRRNVDVTKTRLTIGSVRYFRSLPQCARLRGRGTEVFSFARQQDGDDGRFRLGHAKRLEVYQWFREKVSYAPALALCKETAQIWRELGWDSGNPRCNCAL